MWKIKKIKWIIPLDAYIFKYEIKINYSNISNIQSKVISLIGINYTLRLLIEILLVDNRKVSTAQDISHKSYVGSMHLYRVEKMLYISCSSTDFRWFYHQE